MKVPGNLATKVGSIACVAGKSGGHIVPCLTIANQYCQTHPGAQVLFFTSPLALDKKIIEQSEIVTYHQPLSFYYKPCKLLDYFSCAFYALGSFITSLKDFLWNRPDRLITTGGICAIPVVLAAFCLAIPVDMYVLDAVPGKALSALAPFAANIYCCFDSAKGYFSGQHVLSAQYPVRYLHMGPMPTKQEACHYLGLDPSEKTIFVLGGSQGSTFLNNAITQWVCDHPSKSLKTNIIHQYGNDTRHVWKDWYAQRHINAITFDYAQDLRFFYAAADVVIARAGAGTIFELQAFGKKTVLIPLKADSTTHQLDNAQSILAMYPDLFSVVLQSDVECSAACLYEKINSLLL